MNVVTDLAPVRPAAAAAMPGIEIKDLVVRYGDVDAVRQVSFSVGRGELVTLLGPSGCGKTTTLRAIAGLEAPCGGSIRLGERIVYDAGSRRTVLAEKRGVSMVFQSYAIWPHMTVAQNVAYGLRVRHLGKTQIDAAVDHALGLVQMRRFADRSASMLSGGQQQRVAVARAIAFSPEVLLFDEPLSNLDAKLRAEMRVELRELQQRLHITSLYVTHDQEEALAISDRVIVMSGGQIEQIGTPEAIYSRPASHFVADFLGSANMIRGAVTGQHGDGVMFRSENGHELVLHPAVAPADGATMLVLRSAYVSLTEAGTLGAPNTLAATVHRRMFHGDFIQYVLVTKLGMLIVRRPPTELFDQGADIVASFSREHCLLL
jgi:iron(III) transport system ATP-binding protein